MKQNLRQDDKYQIYSSKRHYKFDITREDLPAFNMTEKQWRQQVINELKDIPKTDYVALIFHDKDMTTDDKPAGLHCHIVVGYKRLKKIRAAQKQINPYSTNDDDFNYATSEGGSIRYLTHRTEKAMLEQKYPYPISDIHLYINGQKQSLEKTIDWYIQKCSIDFVKTETKKQKLKSKLLNFKDELITLVNEGQLLPIDAQQWLTDKLNGDKITANAEITKSFYNELEHQRKLYIDNTISNALKNQANSPLSNIFINGAGGTGKTTFAKSLAYYICKIEKRDMRQIFNGNGSTSNSSTMFSNYAFEHVAIFNEIEYALTQAQFCEQFDQQEYKPVLSRYKNTVNLSRYCIFTKSDNFIKWSRKIGNKNNNDNDGNLDTDKIWQVQRRFNAIVEFDKLNNLIHIKQIDNYNKLTTVKSFQNPGYQDIKNPTNYTKQIFDTIIELCQY